MKFSTLAIIAASFASSVSAVDVDCLVNGASVATVDLDTGVCPFDIPQPLPVEFTFQALDDYLVDCYYALANDNKYFNDIVNAGRIISIPAKVLFQGGDFPLFNIHAEESPAANSTSALRKRLFAGQTQIKRDDASDFAESLKSRTGTPVSGNAAPVFAVALAAPSSSAPSSGSPSTESTSTGTVTSTNTDVITITSCSDNKCTEITAPATETVTDKSTEVITITSCSDNKCTETTVPATHSTVTTTVSGVESIYTTVCPLTETVTDKHTTVVTVTSCSDNKCSKSTVPATESEVVTTVNGVESTYTTVCPITETKASTTVITVTSCSDNKCHETVVPATESEVVTTQHGVESTYTTYCPIETETETTKAPTSVITITSCSGDNCVEKTVPVTVATTTISGKESAYTTYLSVSETTTAGPSQTEAKPTTLAPATTSAATSPAVSTIADNGAASKFGSFAALAMVPVAFFL